MAPKKRLSLRFMLKSGALAVLVVLLANTQNALAVTWVQDPQFNQCLNKLAEKKGWRKAEHFTEIKCHSDGIKSLQGIAKFRKVTKLSLYNNDISDADLSALSDLQHLNMAKNRLGQFGLSNLSQLQELYLFKNEIKKLTLTQLPSLSKMKANSNLITEFKYSGLDSLEKIYLFDNEMEHIDIYSLPQMKYMDVRQNPMPDKLYEEMDAVKGVTILHDGNADDWN